MAKEIEEGKAIEEIEEYNIKKIDLHIHSTVSDGTDTPGEILRKIMEAGIDFFSLTDHDSIKGAVMAREMLRGIKSQPYEAGKSEETCLPCGGKLPLFVCGVELSCRDMLGKYHLLGYGYDPDNGRIRNLVDKVHGFRMQKARDRLDFLEVRYGIRFSDEDARAYLSMDNPGKPQLGNLIAKYGYAPDRNAAIEEYINKLRIKSSFIYPEEAIDSILSGGGVPVLAHPPFGSGGDYITGDDMDYRLRRLIGMGLQGVEAYYSRFTSGLQSEMLYFAEKYGLYVTAGSDYHGSNKLVRLGDNKLKDVREGAPGLKRFISRILS